MDINGQWVGLGLGDVSPTVAAMKQAFVKKFAKTAAPLQASLTAGGTAAETYDETMVEFVTTMQTAYGENTAVNHDLAINGIMNEGWQIRSGFLAPPKITILTAQGTGAGMFDTFSPQPFGAAQYVQQMYPNNVVIQPVGYYPASINNPWMGTSVQDGVNSAVALLGGAPPETPGDPVYSSGPIVGWWYSQSAILGSHLWRDETLNPNGRIHNRLNDWIATVTYGNPCRAPGVANGNKNAAPGTANGANWAMPPEKNGVVTGGISGPDCLTAEQTPSWWYDYVWLGTDNAATELYTQCPIGTNPWTAEAPAGKVGTSIYNIVQKGPTFGDLLSLAADLGMPLGTLEEIWNGITFATKGPAADHYSYNWLASIMYVQWVVKTWVNNYVTSGGALTGAPA